MTDRKLQELKLELPLRPEAPMLARDSARNISKGVDDEQVTEAVVLVLSEIVTNSVRHTNGVPSDTIEIRLVRAPEKIRGEVRDHGPGFEPKPRPLTKEQTSGWGLNIVQNLTERWGVERNGGTCVWFEIRTQTEASG